MGRTDRRVDWHVVIVQITRRDVPVREIARRMGRALSTVQQWAEGSAPKHHDGEKLLDLWSETTRNDRDSAPRVVHPRAHSPRPHAAQTENA